MKAIMTGPISKTGGVLPGLGGSLPLSMTMVLKHDLHAPHLVKIVKLLDRYRETKVTVVRDQFPLPLAFPPSIIPHLAMRLQQGEVVTFYAKGENAAEVLASLREKIDGQIGERSPRALGPRKNIHWIPQGPVEGVVEEVVTVMDAFGVESLAGIYYHGLKRLVVGTGDNLSHKSISRHAGFAYTDFLFSRVNFLREKGSLFAFRPMAPSTEAEYEVGRESLTWLKPLYAGVKLFAGSRDS